MSANLSYGSLLLLTLQRVDQLACGDVKHIDYSVQRARRDVLSVGTMKQTAVHNSLSLSLKQTAVQNSLSLSLSLSLKQTAVHNSLSLLLTLLQDSEVHSS